MKCILLAAGYATRLYPLTYCLPKSLLPIGGSTILELILRKIERVEAVDGIFIVTNDRFAGQFETWAAQYPSVKKITVLNDGTTTNENRLGAIGDLQFAVDRGRIDEDVLVMAGDNLFDFDLGHFVTFFQRIGHDCIMTHELAEMSDLQRTGVIELDGQQKVTAFAEKPACPRSKWAVPPFYLYQRETLPLIRRYLDEGNNPDAPGNFIPWLIVRKDVYAYRFAERCYDIGTVESYQQACRIFEPKS